MEPSEPPPASMFADGGAGASAVDRIASLQDEGDAMLAAGMAAQAKGLFEEATALADAQIKKLVAQKVALANGLQMANSQVSEQDEVDELPRTSPKAEEAKRILQFNERVEDCTALLKERTYAQMKPDKTEKTLMKKGFTMDQIEAARAKVLEALGAQDEEEQELTDAQRELLLRTADLLFSDVRKRHDAQRAVEVAKAEAEDYENGKWVRGCQIFNEESSRKAIEYFAEQKIIEGEVLGKDKGDRVLAKSIARLFRQKAGDGEGKGLAMREVGEFLASGKPLSTMVRTEFANTYDFTGMSYTEALRGYLMSFRLPGESMLIERLLAVFSSRFYRDNPADFSHQLTKERVTELWAAFMKFSAKQRPGTKPDAAVVKTSELGDLVRSLGGDLQYFKDDSGDLEQMLTMEPKAVVHIARMCVDLGLEDLVAVAPEATDGDASPMKEGQADGSSHIIGATEYMFEDQGSLGLSFDVNGKTPAKADTTPIDQNYPMSILALQRKTQAVGKEGLAKGQVLLKVGERLLTGLTYDQVMLMLRTGGRPLKLTFGPAGALGDVNTTQECDVQWLSGRTAELAAELEQTVAGGAAETVADDDESTPADGEAAAAEVAGGPELDFLFFLVTMGLKTGWDSAFVLAYAAIQLNTDAHNPRLEGKQKRMSKKEFIGNNRRSPDLALLSDEYLSGLYDEIGGKEIKMIKQRLPGEEEDGGGGGGGDKALTGSLVRSASVEAQLDLAASFNVQQAGLKRCPKAVRVQVGALGLTLFHEDGRLLETVLYTTLSLHECACDDAGAVLSLAIEPALKVKSRFGPAVKLTTDKGMDILGLMFQKGNELRKQGAVNRRKELRSMWKRANCRVNAALLGNFVSVADLQREPTAEDLAAMALEEASMKNDRYVVVKDIMIRASCDKDSERVGKLKGKEEFEALEIVELEEPDGVGSVKITKRIRVELAPARPEVGIPQSCGWISERGGSGLPLIRRLDADGKPIGEDESHVRVKSRRRSLTAAIPLDWA